MNVFPIIELFSSINPKSITIQYVFICQLHFTFINFLSQLVYRLLHS
jgi:hypothetical protein